VSKSFKQDKALFYEIRVQGVVDPGWSQWLEALDIRSLDNGETVLSGPIRDQSALHGLLAKIRDLGLPLLGVERR